MRIISIDKSTIEDKNSRLDAHFYIVEEATKEIIADKEGVVKRLKDLLSFKSDGSRLRSADNGVPMLRLNNLDACELSFTDLGYGDRSSKVVEVEPRDVLFTVAAEPFRAAVMPEGFDDITVSAEIAILRPNEAILPECLAAILSSEGMNNILKHIGYKGSISALRRISIGDIEQIPVPVPDMDIQNAIKEHYDIAMKLNKEAEEELHDIAILISYEIDQRIPDQATPIKFQVSKSKLTDRLDTGVYANEVFKQRLLESDFAVPFLVIGEVVRLSVSKLKGSDTACGINASNINSKTYLVESCDVAKVSELSPRLRMLVEPGDVLICTTGRGEQTAFVDDRADFSAKWIVGSYTFTAVRFKDTPRFYTLAMGHNIIRTQLENLSTGDRQLFVSKKDIEELVVPDIPQNIRNNYERRIASAFDKRWRAIEARKALMKIADEYVAKTMKPYFS